MVVTISPAECTEAHVFEHIRSLESQACEELGNEISYGTLPVLFDMRRTEEGLYDHQRDMKEDYLPAIHMALGIRHYLRHDSAEDVALPLAEANSLKWYYVAIRPKRDLFTVIKYRSPKPCHAFVLQMAGLTDAYHESHEGKEKGGWRPHCTHVSCRGRTARHRPTRRVECDPEARGPRLGTAGRGAAGPAGLTVIRVSRECAICM